MHGIGKIERSFQVGEIWDAKLVKRFLQTEKIMKVTNSNQTYFKMSKLWVIVTKILHYNKKFSFFNEKLIFVS